MSSLGKLGKFRFNQDVQLFQYSFIESMLGLPLVLVLVLGTVSVTRANWKERQDLSFSLNWRSDRSSKGGASLMAEFTEANSTASWKRVKLPLRFVLGFTTGFSSETA